MWEEPPHILLTNYAMLEYLLLRPRDCNFFDGDTACLLYTSDAADDLLCVDLGGRRIIKKKKLIHY